MVPDRRDDGGLKDLLVQMEKNLSERIGHVEDNVNKRMDQYESKMEQYVLKEVFALEIRNLRDDFESEKIAADKRLTAAALEAESKGRARTQRITWFISILAVVVVLVQYFIG